MLADFDISTASYFLLAALLLDVAGVAILIILYIKKSRSDFALRVCPRAVELFGQIARNGRDYIDEADLDYALNSHFSRLSPADKRVTRDLQINIKLFDHVTGETVWKNRLGWRYFEPIYGVTRNELAARTQKYQDEHRPRKA